MLIARKRTTGSMSIFGVDAQAVRDTGPSSNGGRRCGRIASSSATTVSWDKLAGGLCPGSPTIWWPVLVPWIFYRVLDTSPLMPFYDCDDTTPLLGIQANTSPPLPIPPIRVTPLLLGRRWSSYLITWTFTHSGYSICALYIPTMAGTLCYAIQELARIILSLLNHSPLALGSVIKTMFMQWESQIFAARWSGEIK